MEQSEIALAHAQLSRAPARRGRARPALESIASALSLAPGLAPLWAQFSDLIRYFNLRHPVPPPVRELLSKALEHPAVDPGDLVRPVTTLALSRPDPLEEPLLLRLLEDVVIRDAQLERLITDTRRRMLDEALPLPLMTAIAHQCFNAEYVFDETEAERAQLAALRDRILAAHRYPSTGARRMPRTGRCIRCRARPSRSPRSCAGRSSSPGKNAASPRTFRR